MKQITKNQWTVGNCLLQDDVRLLQCDNSIESIDKDLESPIDWYYNSSVLPNLEYIQFVVCNKRVRGA